MRLAQNIFCITLHQPPMQLSSRRVPYDFTCSKHPTKIADKLTLHAQLSENNDFCSACGASGFLLCCDGCDRSFHFACLDPPLNENASELNEPWYCYICVGKRPFAADQSEKIHRGLFAPLFSSLKRRNPANYLLPDEIRDRNQYVYTGKNGNFQESVQAKTR